MLSLSKNVSARKMLHFTAVVKKMAESGFSENAE